MNKFTTSILSTGLGPINFKWDGTKLAGLILPPHPPPVMSALKNQGPGEDWCDILNLPGIELAGEGEHSFKWDVWHCAQTIPFGETRSYGWMARKIGNPDAARAVGRALGANPWPLLIPCHRIIRTDGTIGGFSSGLKWKRYLLKLEKHIYSSPITSSGQGDKIRVGK